MTKIYVGSAPNGKHVESANQQFASSIIAANITTFTQPQFMLQLSNAGLISFTNTTSITSIPALDNASIGSTQDGAQVLKTYIASLMTPFFYSQTQSYCPVGTIGIDTSTAGLTLANDTIYAFPLYVGYLPVGATKVKIGISTADASGTGDIDVAIFSAAHATSSGTADAPLGTRPVAGVTISDISTTGLKTATISPTIGGGLLWVCLRADNIGTSLILSQPQAVNPSEVIKFFGLASPTTNTPIYGVYYNSQTSMPGTLVNTVASGYITTPVGIAISET